MADSTKIHSDDQVDELFAGESYAGFREFEEIVEDSEAPRLFFIWSLIACIAALIGKNGRLRSGPEHQVPPNLFVVLLGPPGTRKTSAIKTTVKLLVDSTVNFGPTDTGGQRQGIMSALYGMHRYDKYNHRPNLETAGIFISSSPRKPQDMFFVAPELGRLLGAGSTEMIHFLADLYDEADIEYETKSSITSIHSPIASLLGATTPTNLAAMLPESSTGHGILSRTIFVYANEVYKSVPLPAEQNEDWYEKRERFKDRLRWIDYNRDDFGLSPAARTLYSDIYGFIPDIKDPRLGHYRERRSNILLRVGMAVAALRQTTYIEESDIRLSHELLVMIEPEMHRSLEYFGRNKSFSGRMIMLNALRDSPVHSMPEPELLALAASELKPSEASEALERMINTKEVIRHGHMIWLPGMRNELLAAREKRKQA